MIILNPPTRKKLKASRGHKKLRSSHYSLVSVRRKPLGKWPESSFRLGDYIPHALKNPSGSLMGYRPGFIKSALPYALGMFINSTLTTIVASHLSSKWQTGFRRAALSAGLILPTVIFGGKYRAKLAVGGAASALIEIGTPLIGPTIDRWLEPTPATQASTPVATTATAATVDQSKALPAPAAAA